MLSPQRPGKALDPLGMEIQLLDATRVLGIKPTQFLWKNSHYLTTVPSLQLLRQFFSGVASSQILGCVKLTKLTRLHLPLYGIYVKQYTQH